jgi:hypothetical protein
LEWIHRREIEGRGLADHVDVASRIHRERIRDIETAAAESHRVENLRGIRCQFDHPPVRARRPGGVGPPRHIDVARGIDRDVVGLVESELAFETGRRERHRWRALRVDEGGSRRTECGCKTEQHGDGSLYLSTIRSTNHHGELLYAPSLDIDLRREMPWKEQGTCRAYLVDSASKPFSARGACSEM